MLNGSLPILAVSSAPASEWPKQKDQKGDGSDVGFHLPRFPFIHDLHDILKRLKRVCDASGHRGRNAQGLMEGR